MVRLLQAKGLISMILMYPNMDKFAIQSQLQIFLKCDSQATDVSYPAAKRSVIHAVSSIKLLSNTGTEIHELSEYQSREYLRWAVGGSSTGDLRTPSMHVSIGALKHLMLPPLY